MRNTYSPFTDLEDVWRRSNLISQEVKCTFLIRRDHFSPSTTLPPPPPPPHHLRKQFVFRKRKTKRKKKKKKKTTKIMYSCLRKLVHLAARNVESIYNEQIQQWSQFLGTITGNSEQNQQREFVSLERRHT